MKEVEYNFLTTDDANEMTLALNAAHAFGWRRIGDLVITSTGILIQQTFRFVGDRQPVRGHSRLLTAVTTDELLTKISYLQEQGWDVMPNVVAGEYGSLYEWMELTENVQPSQAVYEAKFENQVKIPHVVTSMSFFRSRIPWRW